MAVKELRFSLLDFKLGGRMQVAAGVLAGMVFILLLTGLASGGFPSAMKLARIGAYGLVMALVCLLACIVPTRRALRVEPTDALRMDA